MKFGSLPRLAPTPRLPAAALLIIFVIVIGLEAGPLYNSNALLSLWGSAGVLSSVEAPEDLESIYKRTLIYFQTADSFGSPLMGFLLDNFGPRITSAAGSLIQALGTALMLVPNKTVFNFAGIVQGVAILMVINSALSIGNLLVPHQSFAVALLSGAADLSTAVYVGIGFLGPGLYWSGMWSYVALCVLCAVLSLAFLPSTAFERIDRDRHEAEKAADDEDDDSNDKESSLPSSNERWPLRPSTGSQRASIGPRSMARYSEFNKISSVFTTSYELSARPVSLKSQILSLQYISFFFFFSFGTLRQNFYLNNNILLLKGKGSDYMHYANFLAKLMPSGIIFAMVIGHLADKTSIMTTALLVNGAACSVYLLSLVSSLQIQYISFILFMGQKCCLYTLMFIFIAQSFGFSHFGLLTSLCTIGGGLFNLLQLPIDDYIDNDYNRARQVTFAFFLTSLLFYIPLVILVRFPYGAHRKAKASRVDRRDHDSVTSGRRGEGKGDGEVEHLAAAPSKQQASRRSLSRISNTSSVDEAAHGSPSARVRVGDGDD